MRSPVRDNKQITFFPKSPAVRTLEALLLESTQLSILERIYDQAYDIKIIRAFAPDFIGFLSQLSIEASMPSLAKSYEELERSQNWGIIPTKESIPDLFFNVDKLFEYHRTQLAKKRDELDQRFFEIEEQLEPALKKQWESEPASRTRIIEKIVAPLFQRLIEHSSVLVKQLTGGGEIMDQAVDLMQNGDNRDELDCNILMLSRTGEFFLEYLSRISRHFLSENLYNKHENVFLCFDELCGLIQSTLGFMVSKKSIDEYSQDMLSLKYENMLEIEKMTPRIIEDFGFSECESSLKNDKIELRTMRALLQRSKVSEETIQPFNDLIAAFTFALNFLRFYDGVSSTWRSCRNEFINKEVMWTVESAQAVSRWINVLSSDEAKLRDMHSRSKNLYGDDNFCPQIFQELFAVSEELIRQMSEIKNNLYQAEVQFLKALEAQSIELANEIASGLRNLDSFHGLVERFLSEGPRAEESSESQDMYKQLLRMAEKSRLGEEIREPLKKICDKAIGFFDKQMDSIARLLGHAKRFKNLEDSSVNVEDFHERYKQLSHLRQMYVDLGDLSPIEESLKTKKLCEFVETRRKALAEGLWILDAIRPQLDECLIHAENQNVELDQTEALRIFSALEKAIKTLHVKFIQAKIGHQILLEIPGLNDKQKTFFVKIYFEDQDLRFKALVEDLSRELSDISQYLIWGSDPENSPRNKEEDHPSSAKRKGDEAVLQESSKKTHHANFSPS